MDARATNGDAAGGRRPAVSIILPTYNRARFLPQAFEAIRGQRFADWELIVVDDGSADDTREVVAGLTREWTQPVRYLYQENQGAYGARNTGLGLARGDLIAFYDSDDVWLPHHLQDCVLALEADPGVDWVYGASRVVAFASGEVLHPSAFYRHGRPRPFLTLRTRARGRLRIIEDDRAVRCAILHGLYAGLQCSVIRGGVFAGYRFEARSRNEAEDQLIVVEALAAGRRLAYFDDVHVIYRVHDQNSSAAAGSVEKHARVIRALAEGYEGLRGRVRLTRGQARARDRRLSRVYFWDLGYALLRQPGREAEALGLLRRGLRLWPWDPRYWKTYLLAWSRGKLGARAGTARPAASTAHR